MPPGVTLAWAEWDDDPDAVIAYNTLSGQTHLLDRLSAEVLRALAGGACDEAALVVALALPEDARPRVAEICRTFEALGLADRIDR